MRYRNSLDGGGSTGLRFRCSGDAPTCRGNIAGDIADREIKLGPGGLRDVEFSVQLLQLVHGRSDVMLRSPTTLVALEALATWGYVGREDASALAYAYRFLRTLEHGFNSGACAARTPCPKTTPNCACWGVRSGFAPIRWRN